MGGAQASRAVLPDSSWRAGRVCILFNPLTPPLPHPTPTETGEMALEPATPMHAEVRTSLELPTSGEVQAVDGGAPPTPAAAATAAATAASSCSQSGSSRSRFESINRVAAVAGREYSVRRSGEKQRRSEERQRRGLGSRQQGGGVSRQSVPARQQQPWSHAPAVEGTAAARLAAAPLPAAPEFDIRRHVAAWVAASAAAASSAPPGEGPDQAWAPASSHGSNSDGWERAAAAAAMAAEVTALPKSCPPSRTSPQRIASAPAVEPPKSPPSSSPKKEGGTASRSLAHSSSAGALLGGACSGAGGATSEKPGSGGGKDICSRCNPIAALARLLRL